MVRNSVSMEMNPLRAAAAAAKPAPPAAPTASAAAAPAAVYMYENLGSVAAPPHQPAPAGLGVGAGAGAATEATPVYADPSSMLALAQQGGSMAPAVMPTYQNVAQGRAEAEHSLPKYHELHSFTSGGNAPPNAYGVVCDITAEAAAALAQRGAGPRDTAKQHYAGLTGHDMYGTGIEPGSAAGGVEQPDPGPDAAGYLAVDASVHAVEPAIMAAQGSDEAYAVPMVSGGVPYKTSGPLMVLAQQLAAGMGSEAESASAGSSA